MIKKPLLSYKIPYVGKDVDVTTVLNYMAKVLNSTFRDTPFTVSDIPSSLIPVFVDFDFSIGHNTTITLNHNLNVIPTGWMIIDHTEPALDNSFIVRTAWSTTQITLKNFNNNSFSNVTYKIRVFI